MSHELATAPYNWNPIDPTACERPKTDTMSVNAIELYFIYIYYIIYIFGNTIQEADAATYSWR